LNDDASNKEIYLENSYEDNQFLVSDNLENNVFIKVCCNVKCIEKLPEQNFIKIHLFNNLCKTNIIHYFCTNECVIEFYNKYYKFYKM
jgi:hypothetical protein